MYLLVAGYRYKNAPLEIRERFSFKPEDLPVALNKILEYPSIKEAVILSTCNRTEIYTLVENTEVATGSIVRFLSDFHNLDVSDIRKYMFTLMHEDTIRQIFKVTSGLDSMILGENEITHQVKEAFSLAQNSESAGVILDKLFKAALSTNKRVRTQTNITSIVDNISSGAIELVRESLNDITDKHITILGAGQMASLALKYLVAKYDHKNITVLNRSQKPLESIYDHYHIPVGHITELKNTLANSDILFVCTSAPHSIVKKDHIPDITPLIIVDISVPRNVDPEVANLNNVTLFNIDDIQALVNKYVTTKNQMIAKAEDIIKEETEKFDNWMMHQNIVPTLKGIRDKIENIRKQKLEQMRDKACPYSDERCQLIENLSRQLVNTILHDPTVKIKATENHEELFKTAKLLNEMFDLKENDQN